MALYDENGTITIDEVAAERDVKALLQAKECLLNVQNLLKEVEAIAMDFSGNANIKILESAQKFQSKINILNDSITDCSETVQSTVRKYQLKDETIKGVIGASFLDK